MEKKNNMKLDTARKLENVLRFLMVNGASTKQEIIKKIKISDDDFSLLLFTAVDKEPELIAMSEENIEGNSREYYEITLGGLEYLRKIDLYLININQQIFNKYILFATFVTASAAMITLFIQLFEIKYITLDFRNLFILFSLIFMLGVYVYLFCKMYQILVSS